MRKQEQYEQELDIHRLAHEAGLRALRDWLYREREEINAKWPALHGEDLTRLQGEARAYASVIRMLENGPRIKQGGGV